MLSLLSSIPPASFIAYTTGVHRYKNIGLTVKSGFDHKDEAVKKVLAILQHEQCDVCVDARRMADVRCVHGCAAISKRRKLDLIIVIGGDGTVLRTIREMPDLSVPVLSVNRGTVGFLAEIELNEVERVLPALLRGQGTIDERSLLHVRAFRGRKELYAGNALNEAVIAQGTIARLIDLQTSVNGEPLTTYRADGLIVATPTGSTAYSLAAGGPIVHPGFNSAVILTPLNPHSFSQKPIVLSGESRIDVTVRVRARKFADVDVNLTIDGQMYVRLQDGDALRVTTSERSIRFLRRKQDTFLQTLRTKLKWGE